MKRRKNFVILTGGLGNQLFQVNYAKFLSERDDVPSVLFPMIGNPRRDKNHYPDSHFAHSELELRDGNSRVASFLRRVSGFLLRTHLNPRTDATYRWNLKASRFLGALIFSIFLRRLTTVSVPRDIGYVDSKKIGRSSRVHIGYFQTHKYGNRLELDNNQLAEKDPNFGEIFSKMSLKAETDDPIVVHVRLTDYRADENFGILSPEYYQSAIELAIMSTGLRNLWVFSDEPDNCLIVIPPEYIPFTTIINFPELSAFQNLLLMRLGKAYVLANSSYSWWAAFDSTNQPSLTISPTPWFARMKTPKYLVPDHWSSLPR